MKWQFDTLPETAYDQTGTSNVWSSMSIDPDNSLVFLPISSPSPDFFGGARKEDLPYANSVTALNADTGKVVWSRQLVHHDIWDYDINSAPVLIDIQEDGQSVPVLVQSSKQGLLFVLNRLTGEPVYPIEEKPFPASDIDGEQTSPTQPMPTGMEPTTPDRFPGISWLADAVSGGYCSRTMDQLRYEGRYTPPSLKGTLAFPATAGGVEWGGGAVDPTWQFHPRAQGQRPTRGVRAPLTHQAIQGSAYC